METQIVLLLLGVTLVIGVSFGYFLRWIISMGKRGSMELKIKQMMLEARDEAKKIVSESEKKAEEILEESRKEIKEKEKQLKKLEDRFIKKEEFIDQRQMDLNKEEDVIKKKLAEAEKVRADAENLDQQKTLELEKISGLSKEDAIEELLKQIEKNTEEDLLVRMRKLENIGSEKLENRAREILTTAIHRLGNFIASDVMSTTISIPSDEVKGKVIGKEGRNIRAFERAAGVEIIVDDTPGSITISSFDPVRRQVARIALENLILDGRIQPAKIEEAVELAQKEINRIIKEKGEQAVYECGVYNLDPKLVSLLGRLYFRTSYGQNVLQHSIEMSHIAGMIAEELGANVSVAKAGAILHDIGKAVDHEVVGTHAQIGRRILQKFNVNEDIVKAMQSHHEEYPYETLESIIVQVADSISGSRPGARRDTVENYLKRLKELESIANSFEGIDKSFALQAGREIRVFVTPEKISDLQAKKLARDIALKIEQELKYPGEVKINVIRETRVTEYAR